LNDCAQSNADVDKCDCKAGFTFSIETKFCHIDCSGPKIAGKLSPPQIDVCKCDGGYYWNTTTLSCKLDCAPNATNNLVGTLSSTDTTKCACVENTITPPREFNYKSDVYACI